MSTEASKLIHEGIKAQEANRREELWREIYGPPVLPADLLNRPLGNFDDSRRKGVLVYAKMGMEKAGFAAAPIDIARLVDARLRRGAAAKAPDHKTIAAEIEAALDLVEHCQWRIELRKAEWRERCGLWLRPYFEQAIPPEEKAARAKIENQTYPLDFHKGLVLIGVGGDGPKEREKRFQAFYREQCIFSAKMRHQYGGAMEGKVSEVRSLDDFVEPPETELLASFEHRKKIGWTDAEWLLHERVQWQRYNLSQMKLKRSAAGKKSGEVRKPQGKPVKAARRRK